MSYLDLLKLAAPEAIVTLTALVVLVIGLTTSRGTVVAGVSVAMPKPAAAGAAAATRFCTLVGALGLIIAIEAIVLLPSHANLFHGMLVISPLNSLFQIVCLVLAFFIFFFFFFFFVLFVVFFFFFFFFFRGCTLLSLLFI